MNVTLLLTLLTGCSKSSHKQGDKEQSDTQWSLEQRDSQWSKGERDTQWPNAQGYVQPSRQQNAFQPTEFGPQTLEEAEIARTALQGNYYGGDIVMNWSMDKSNSVSQLAGINMEQYLWPDGKVAYVTDTSLNTPAFQTVLSNAIAQYTEKTCIRFVPRTNERDYVNFTKADGCYSSLGRQGGKQDISIGEGCVYIGTVIHEMMHAIGFFHEHQRTDRNRYIAILYTNVQPGAQSQFTQTPKQYELILSAYNIDSIMHYGNYAFSVAPDALPTIIAYNGRRITEPYDKPGFADTDVEQIKKLYKC